MLIVHQHSQNKMVKPESEMPKYGTRHVLVLMGLLGFANVYCMRVNLSVAIVAMVNNTAIHHQQDHSSNECSPGQNLPETNSSATSTAKEGPFAWDEKTQGRILGAFFYGYVLTQVPGGRLAELFGGKWLFGGGVFITAVFTLLTPLAAKTSIYLFYAVRVVEGLGEGVTFPAMLAMLAKWATPAERSRFVSYAYAGSSFGTVVSLPISGLLCDYVGWESVFYVFGVLGVVWFVGWIFLAYDSPEVHPRISEQEKIYIMSSLVESEMSKPKSIPWKGIVCSGPVWGIAAAHITQNFGYYVLLTELPSYLKILPLKSRIRGFFHNKSPDSRFSLKLFIISYSLYKFDRNIRMLSCHIIFESGLSLKCRQVYSRTGTRKIANTIATQVPALALLGASFSGCNKTLSVALLTLAVGANGAIFSGEQSAMLDIGNNFAGTLMGIINALGNTMGFIAPTFTGLITNDHNDTAHWQIVFFVAVFIYWVGNCIFLLLGSSEEQAWNRISTVTQEPGNTSTVSRGRREENFY
ncbi:putative inorganic phosphate cotransporter [Eurytemora carolleeae]|uniref:putative inorganic phosphate cotransporter n=1 Tax=Eurytemora carolleeae TaxID=1294199 RepID=UPI000C75C4E9|nr:putative inorganic phosphate cotransporter [Eurytemora carolleeae]|eukprot:XP_023326905.1 putative inorganic phosphate cotransporter [Eurytemora affinis]